MCVWNKSFTWTGAPWYYCPCPFVARMAHAANFRPSPAQLFPCMANLFQGKARSGTQSNQMCWHGAGKVFAFAFGATMAGLARLATPSSAGGAM